VFDSKPLKGATAMEPQVNFEVTWTAKYSTTITLEPGQVLDDAIQDINIPEDANTSYISDTFEVEEVRNLDTSKAVPSRMWGKVVGA
jgi:hypothetical protein